MPSSKKQSIASSANIRKPFRKEISVKRLIALLVLAVSLGALASQAYAQAKIVRGEGAVIVQGVMASGPSEEDRGAAMKAAKLMAWRSYLALPGQNETVDQIRTNEKLFLDRLDELLVDLVTVEEVFNKDSKRYMLRIKATVAESVVNSMIREFSKGGAKGQAAFGTGSSAVAGVPILVLGMAREADVVKSFMEKETKVTETSRDSESNKMKQGAGGRTAAASESGMSTVRTKDVTGGNREKKRDKVTYKIGNVSILNSKLPRILLQNGIKASPYAFLMRPCKLPNPDNFSKQYAASDIGELPAKVMADIQENLAACGKVKYWVFASMDVGGYGTDPNTGLNLATVTVNVQLMEVETGAQLASASKDVPGRSADQGDAIKMATEGAVQAVGDIITAQVANLGR